MGRGELSSLGGMELTFSRKSQWISESANKDKPRLWSQSSQRAEQVRRLVDATLSSSVASLLHSPWDHLDGCCVHDVLRWWWTLGHHWLLQDSEPESMCLSQPESNWFKRGIPLATQCSLVNSQGLPTPMGPWLTMETVVLKLTGTPWQLPNCLVSIKKSLSVVMRPSPHHMATSCYESLPSELRAGTVLGSAGSHTACPAHSEFNRNDFGFKQ